MAVKPEEEFIINVICLIDDLFQQLFLNARRTRGYELKLTQRGSNEAPIHSRKAWWWEYVTPIFKEYCEAVGVDPQTPLKKI